MRFLHLDVFQGEGVAYRGRVLVELSTQLDGKIDKNIDDISSDDILVAQVYAVYLSYVLTAMFLIYFIFILRAYSVESASCYILLCDCFPLQCYNRVALKSFPTENISSLVSSKRETKLPIKIET